MSCSWDLQSYSLFCRILLSRIPVEVEVYIRSQDGLMKLNLNCQLLNIKYSSGPVRFQSLVFMSHSKARVIYWGRPTALPLMGDETTQRQQPVIRCQTNQAMRTHETPIDRHLMNTIRKTPTLILNHCMTSTIVGWITRGVALRVRYLKVVKTHHTQNGKHTVQDITRSQVRPTVTANNSLKYNSKDIQIVTNFIVI